MLHERGTAILTDVAHSTGLYDPSAEHSACGVGFLTRKDGRQTYELLKHLETPFKVVINEAILMATEFGAEGGHTFVNGVLTKVAAATRAIEMGAASKNSN